MHYTRFRKGIPMDMPIRNRKTKQASTCSVQGCDDAVKAKNLCAVHYARLRTGKDVTMPRRRKRGTGRGQCKLDFCCQPAVGSGYCQFHYNRHKTGQSLDVTKEFLQSVDAIKWRTDKNGYVIGSLKGKHVLQHRFVWEQHHGRPLHPFENIHHINGRRDDNRIENLELWTKAQPCGQRPEDLVAWVVDNYPDLIQQHMKGKSNDKSAGARRATSGNKRNQRPTSRPTASRRPSSRALPSR